jgi:hypothetical protein
LKIISVAVGFPVFEKPIEDLEMSDLALNNLEFWRLQAENGAAKDRKTKLDPISFLPNFGVFETEPKQENGPFEQLAALH